MNWYFILAAALTFTTGLIHTVFGERLIFKRMRGAGLIPTNGGQLLREPHVRILWASWHAFTLLGWLLAVLLVWLALPEQAHMANAFLVRAILTAALATSALVCVGTKGRHPGWVALLGVAILTGLGT